MMAVLSTIPVVIGTYPNRCPGVIRLLCVEPSPTQPDHRHPMLPNHSSRAPPTAGSLRVPNAQQGLAYLPRRVQSRVRLKRRHAQPAASAHRAGVLAPDPVLLLTVLYGS